jgi:SAM-dependent methyltransferase
MPVDIRLEAAKFYDNNPDTPNDIPFYLERIPSPQSSILELGCGTGRVTLPLAARCGTIHGIDLSPAMISICREKIARMDMSPDKIKVEIGDITDFDLGRRFDLIIAPFRVLQNLETDVQVDGLFECIHRHLAPGGSCILNVFRPNRDPKTLRQIWVSSDEQLEWEVPVEGGRLACYDRRPRMDPEKLVLYPELIYRLYQGETLIEESILKIAMRCYYPNQFINTIRNHGFKTLGYWGGYQGEPYGEGPELVVQFKASNLHV